MLKKYNKMNDITKILIAMLLGSLLGILLPLADCLTST